MNSEKLTVKMTSLGHRILSHLITIGDGVSQLLNVVLFFSDNANESISGRAARVYELEKQRHVGWEIAYKVINFIFFTQRNHCLESFWKDVERADRLVEKSYHLRIKVD